MKTLLQIAKTPVRVSEKTVEARCDDLVAQISGRQDVVRFSQARATGQTLGISDRRYRAFGRAFWFEVKAEDGKLSREQLEFLGAEHACGELACCGGVEELKTVLTALRIETERQDHDDFALDICRRIVQDWQGRGIRGEKSPRKPRKEKTT